MTWLIDMA